MAVSLSHSIGSFFVQDLSARDSEVFDAIADDARRQRRQIELIAPKNYLSKAGRQALSSIMAFTSVEGYPGRRYHAGVANIDRIERLAVERARAMFQAAHANVQAHSGTQANQAVYFALLEPGDVVLSMDLPAGGHLSHGLKSNLSGKWFRTVSYGIRADGRIDYDDMRSKAEEHRPRLIIVGGSSYPRAIDFATVGRIARGVGAYVMADVSHFSGLIVGGVYPHPFPHVDIVTTTTNKNLRGPRGGLILARDEAMGKRIDSAVFPGIQGGPLPEMMTAKAVCFGEALTPEFRSYAATVLENAQVLADGLQRRGYDIVTGGTDTPLVVVDLRSRNMTGDIAQEALEAAGLTCNRNLVPFDREKPQVTSGLRMGTSAISARGMGANEAAELAGMIADVLDRVADGARGEAAVPGLTRTAVERLADGFPIYPEEDFADVRKS